jgi:hypothetical protein
MQWQSTVVNHACTQGLTCLRLDPVVVWMMRIASHSRWGLQLLYGDGR